MGNLFALLVVLSVIWSVIRKLREAQRQRESGGGPPPPPTRRPITLGEAIRREIERQQREAAGEVEVPEAAPLLEIAPEREEPAWKPGPEYGVPQRKGLPVTVPEEVEAPTEIGFELPTDAQSARSGIVLAEILGPCRALAPHEV